METATKQLLQTYPILQKMSRYEKIFWKNPHDQEHEELPFSQASIFDAAARWDRFAPYLETVFPETRAAHGMIESPLIPIPGMKKAWEAENQTRLRGDLFLKADHLLPVSGSIKSRGGIYEVLKFAEKVALSAGDLTFMDDYSVLASERYRRLFSQYGIAVGSTGNLGLSIGTAAASFGFRTTVHMSADARQWKKDLLRARGVTVIEHPGDFTEAVTKGRAQAAADPKTHFIDDESSTDLFLGYAVAAIRLQKQLKDQHICVDADHPLFVYLPAGVGGSPGGVTFGLKQILGPHGHSIFVEPTHVPSVTLGMITGLNETISVYDLGLDGKTRADGLAVARPSALVGRVMRTLLTGAATFDDQELFRYLALLADTQHLFVEPSAAAGFTGIRPVLDAFGNSDQATHIVWATGGSLVPETERKQDYQTGKKLING
ncbi:D-serine ammonia-lyase [Sporolactobacillus vineae]|uniref:D-serine ammonia-lyase n=1 Tax=Sporolactobacillus vineae TaxID=444463 RepID=UPI000289EC10|nr:D-serine ammonia-lyase [Sporolactobacillus vineae]